jgi:U3 small nucleolar RNA-associated protein 20
VLEILLARLAPSAALSLPALLDVVAALARDLQGDFVPLLPRVTAR